MRASDFLGATEGDTHKMSTKYYRSKNLPVVLAQSGRKGLTEDLGTGLSLTDTALNGKMRVVPVQN